MLVIKHELFKIEQNKSITKIFTRFIDIINDFKSLEKSYANISLFKKSLDHFS